MSETKYFDAVLLYSHWARGGVFDKYAGFIALNYDLSLNNHGKEVSDSLFNDEMGISIMGKEHYDALYKNRDTFLVSTKALDSEKVAMKMDSIIYDGLVTSLIESIEIPGSTLSVYVVGKVILYVNNLKKSAVGYIAIDETDVQSVPFITANARDWELCLTALNYENVYDFVQKQTSDRVVEVS